MAKFFHLFYIQIERRLISPTVNKITPLIGGTHFPIFLKDNNFGMLAAKVPAMNKGTICPIAKLPRKIVPLKGLPCFATQARRTARTGLILGTVVGRIGDLAIVEHLGRETSFFLGYEIKPGYDVAPHRQKPQIGRAHV